MSHIDHKIDTEQSQTEIPGEDISDQDTVFKVVMLRSGDVEWDVKNLYSGWNDSKLSFRGRTEIIAASEILKNENYTFDLAYCSILNRGRESLSLILDQLDLREIEVQQCWELNERHCGAFTGYNKDEMNAKYGNDQINFWFNSYYSSPPPISKQHKYYHFIYNNTLLPKNIVLPLTESLDMVQKRMIAFWNKKICPNILSGRKILLVTHNCCLKALIQYLEDYRHPDFSDADLKIPRATPFYYKLDETLRPILVDSFQTL